MDQKLDSVVFLFFIVLTLVAIVVGAIWMTVTEKRLKRFFLGKKAKDLEDTIVVLENEIAKLNKAKDVTQKDIVMINTKLKKSIRGLETVRFNPFADQGSNQSFAIGLLN